MLNTCSSWDQVQRLRLLLPAVNTAVLNALSDGKRPWLLQHSHETFAGFDRRVLEQQEDEERKREEKRERKRKVCNARGSTFP